ncbi:23S rRNA pseudouridine(1911/1915/1917) synthase RluD [Litorivicinus sp.]|jgi:23S rRNA pseudouridine1911/1915/1917 synthase|nr:23S rRNA pseudouridine(1911/1915/1917) synthase RluD [Litorivicinus sp.]
MTDRQYTKTHIQSQFCIPLEESGARIDQVLPRLMPEYSRARLSQWLTVGAILIDGQFRKPRYKVFGGEEVVVNVTLEPQTAWSAEESVLDVVFEDESIIVVNKPSGLVVHPGHGNPSGTLVNALLGRYPELEQIPRAGIVHRLDKDTSGLLAVARTLPSQVSLVKQLKDRSMSRKYLALVYGHPDFQGTIDAPIDRHRVQRTKMAVVTSGKPAITHFEIFDKTAHCAWMSVKLESGRTHQIRVHMTHIGHPLVGDPVYRQGRPGLGRASSEAQFLIDSFSRQALHASVLGLLHPRTGKLLECEAPLPSDLSRLRSELARVDI